MYVWQHDLKVDTIDVKQVTIFNDFVDSQWFSEPTHALPSMNCTNTYVNTHQYFAGIDVTAQLYEQCAIG